MSTEPEALLELARRAAHGAGAVLVERFHGPLSGVESKSTRTDLVSDADRAAEQVILEMLAAARPDDAIMAEEGGSTRGTSGVRWAVDPLDGTINYLWRLPYWAVSIAAHDDAGALAAVVYDPSRRETFVASRGGGARDDNGTLNVRTESSLDEALIGTGFSYSAEERARQAERLNHVLPRVRDVRRFGAAALDLAWVAAGRLDGFFEAGLAPWDWAAGDLLVREAGGRIEVLPARDDGSECVIGSSAALMPELRTLVAAVHR